MRRAVSACHRIRERRCRLGLTEIRHAAFSLALAFSWLSLSALAQAQLAQADRIHVEISGLRSDKGQVLCALFSSATDFPKKTDKAVAQAKSDISNGHAVCEFAGIASGTYAVSVFHDENSNGKLDTNIMGIPREGVGASNNARGHFGPPKFAAAAFQFSGGRIDLKITINYL
jgi:uncharacterized protein (DUF2141 family)